MTDVKQAGARDAGPLLNDQSAGSNNSNSESESCVQAQSALPEAETDSWTWRPGQWRAAEGQRLKRTGKNQQELTALRTARLEQIATEVNTAHDRAHDAARSAIEHAIECGRLLIEARQKVNHGGWLPWVENNLQFGARQAQKYMRLAEHAGDCQMRIQNSYLDLDGALKLLAKPRAEVEAGTDKPAARTPGTEARPEPGADAVPAQGNRKARRRRPEEAARMDAEAESLATRLIEQLDHDTVRELQRQLYTADHCVIWRLTEVLGRKLKIDGFDDDEGNEVDPESSADAMKAKFAAPEEARKPIIADDDGLGIPTFLRRGHPDCIIGKAGES
jgi:hypothetical protein